MFIAHLPENIRRGSEGRNETRLALVKLSSAPPNRAAASQAIQPINMSPLTG